MGLPGAGRVRRALARELEGLAASGIETLVASRVYARCYMTARQVTEVPSTWPLTIPPFSGF